MFTFIMNKAHKHIDTSLKVSAVHAPPGGCVSIGFQLNKCVSSLYTGTGRKFPDANRGFIPDLKS